MSLYFFAIPSDWSAAVFIILVRLYLIENDFCLQQNVGKDTSFFVDAVAPFKTNGSSFETIIKIGTTFRIFMIVISVAITTLFKPTETSKTQYFWPTINGNIPLVPLETFTNHQQQCCNRFTIGWSKQRTPIRCPILFDFARPNVMIGNFMVWMKDQVALVSSIVKIAMKRIRCMLLVCYRMINYDLSTTWRRRNLRRSCSSITYRCRDARVDWNCSSTYPTPDSGATSSLMRLLRLVVPRRHDLPFYSNDLYYERRYPNEL